MARKSLIAILGAVIATAILSAGGVGTAAAEVKVLSTMVGRLIPEILLRA